MLEPWSLNQRWLKKRVARWLYQDRDLKKAAALHATAESEAEQFRKLGFKNYCIVSPNGVNVPEGNFEPCGNVERVEGIDRREAAEKKVEQWLDGVDEATFEAALATLVEEKTAAGEYRFKKPEELKLALEGARRFFREFSRRIIDLSDGRCVYFAPDLRAKTRNADNAVSWAEYAFHAVSSSGQLMAGSSTLRERWFNHNKNENLVEIERIIREEHGIYRLIDAHPENDAVIFVGVDANGGRMEVVSRLDEYGNADANLGEVTVVVRHKGKKGIPPPKFRPLTEVVEAVAKHQAAGFSPSTTEKSIANRRDSDKGENQENRSKPHLALFVSRMHPKKGVLELVESWARVFKSKSRVEVEDRWVCELVYTLNGDTEREYEQRVKQWILDLGMTYVDAAPSPRQENDIHSSTSTSNFDFIFTGALDDDAKWQAYARADLFVLPTYSENFGIVVAEALWAGVPVITTKGTPWSDLVSHHCGWWIDLPEDGKTRSARDSRAQTAAGCAREVTSTTDETWPALDQALREACGAEGLRALPAMGENGHRLVESKYTWEAVIKAMVHGYEQVLNPCELAPCDYCENYGDTCPMK